MHKRGNKKGEVIRREQLVCKQPLRDADKFFTGLEVDAVVGKTAAADIGSDTPIERKLIL
ncbi:SAF domain-containing protein [Maridesulfovibrio sp.]|uniref:SAF domain-containing protein n=1 Tax=Maridesulfovibrio sp. TaxID=2795000 RepID=UPI0038B248B4